AQASSPVDRRLQRQRRRQLLEAARSRYQALSYQEKSALVDELVEISGYHRKSVLRLLRQQPADHGGPPAGAGAVDGSAQVAGRRRYGPEVVQLLETLWEASDHLCGKRLAAVLPTLVTALERHGHLEIEPALKELLMQVSPATIDRLLAPARAAQSGQHRRRRSRIVSGVRRRTAVRTFNGWKGVEPGWFEMDLVAHCGGRMEGPFLWTLVLTDVASGWSECIPLPSRDGLLVRSALEELQKLMPLPLRGLDVDNDTAFMNEELERWCAEARKPVELTRSRAYKSNDQAWVEQKNGMLVRRVVGHRRLEGTQQLERLCQLYAALRLFTNIYQPSAKRIPFEEGDLREGRRPRRRHDEPLTPADRLLRWSGMGRRGRQRIEVLQQQCDPVALLETIRNNQTALVNGEREPGHARDSAFNTTQELDTFLKSLRLLWQRSEPAKRGGWHMPSRTYRTRADPTLACWPLVLEWLMADPLLTGSQAMQRLEREQPGLYGGSLRTLQRRMTLWRVGHAEQVVGQQMGAFQEQENNQLNRKK
ncbi:MAG: transposase family protein, partial [Cyanobium sp.]